MTIRLGTTEPVGLIIQLVKGIGKLNIYLTDNFVFTIKQLVSGFLVQIYF